MLINIGPGTRQARKPEQGGYGRMGVYIRINKKKRESVLKTVPAFVKKNLWPHQQIKRLSL